MPFNNLRVELGSKGVGRRLVWLVAIVLAVATGGFYAWLKLRPAGPGEGFVSGNGRIEATEIDVATKIPGVKDVVNELRRVEISARHIVEG